MKIEEIAKLIDAQIDYLPEGYDVDITTAGASDLMSDVLAYVAEDIILITGLLSPQVIRVSSLMDISAVVFIRGKKPTPEILDAAKDAGIAVLSSDGPSFSTCGILYQAGIGGIQNRKPQGDDNAPG